MLHISAAALLLFGMGFLKVMVSTANIQAQPGETVPMWCSHSIHVSGDLYWFKQTDGAVPITIAKMLFTESLQKVKPNYFNDYTKDRLVMNQSIKSTLLTIINVTTSDSGFYFCGFMGYPLKFGNGTSLEVKVTEVQTPQHDDKENDSVEYAAVHFANKRPKSSRRHAEDSVCTVSVYTDAT
ncbi:novel immune-type receptor 10a isoform 1 precursor [Danio rerio]|uniref:Novel immune-type receptor 10a isoform 1 precursor n=1 Tax=Danio rerio TaxID=7955 RepID=A0AB12Y5D2_DANRE|nr:novel immune-type receptor 10a isoform 1 precursor [Danio rerio]